MDAVRKHKTKDSSLLKAVSAARVSAEFALFSRFQIPQYDRKRAKYYLRVCINTVDCVTGEEP